MEQILKVLIAYNLTLDFLGTHAQFYVCIHNKAPFSSMGTYSSKVFTGLQPSRLILSAAHWWNMCFDGAVDVKQP